MRVSAVANMRKAWRSSVEHMFDGDIELKMMTTVFPSDDGWRNQKRTCSTGKVATQD